MSACESVGKRAVTKGKVRPPIRLSNDATQAFCAPWKAQVRRVGRKRRREVRGLRERGGGGGLVACIHAHTGRGWSFPERNVGKGGGMHRHCEKAIEKDRAAALALARREASYTHRQRPTGTHTHWTGSGHSARPPPLFA